MIHPQLPITPSADAVGVVTSSSLVSAISDAWMNIHSYFMDVQMAEDEKTRKELASRLPQVENFLQVILDALAQEHTHMISTPVSNIRNMEKWSVSSVSSRSSFLASPKRAASLNSCGNGGTNVDKMALLTPCYTFLWSDETFTPSSETDNKVEEGLTPIGNIFFLSLCQFAKHNEPPGSRLIILRFFTHLLAELDLPRLPYMGDPPRSLLQMFSSNTIVPLMDMICKVGLSLRSKTSTKNSIVTVIPLSSSSSPSAEVGTHILDDDREAFLTFLCILTERMEQVPALAAFFLPNGAIEKGGDIDNNEIEMTSTNHEKPFILLQEFLAYVSLGQSSLHSDRRNKICQLALRGLLSLAKCPDPDVQDYVKRYTEVASVTLTEARTTLLTLCKVPDNDDGAAQLNCLCDILSFWTQLLLLAPSVAEAWEVEHIIEYSFVRETLLPLFQSVDDNVYAAAAVVTARTIRTVGRVTSSLYVSSLTRAVLGTQVDLLTGKLTVVLVGPHSSSSPKESTSTSPINTSNTPSSTTISLLEYVLLPHLTIQSRDNWKDTEVTLHLLHTFALYEPVLFMEFALSLSLSTLAEVYLKGSSFGVGSKKKIVDGDSPTLKDATTTTTTTTSTTDINGITNRTRHVDCHQQVQMLDIDLSASSTSPSLDVANCFSERLRAPKGVLLWSDAECIAEEILARLLLVESHVPTWLLEKRQCVMNRSCRNQCVELMGNPTPDKGKLSTVAEKSSLFQEKDNHDSNSKNIWFHEGVNSSSLVQHLCELTSNMVSIPSDVCTLLTNLWCTLCVMPDLRVLYTLMDPEYGKLRHALLKLRDAIDTILQGDEELVFSVASAAAASALSKGGKTTTTSTTINAKSTSITAAAAAAAAAVASSTSASSASTEIQSKLIHEDSTTHHQPLKKTVHNLTPHIYTRTYLYSQFIQLGPSLRWVGGVVEREFPNHELLAALKEHRVFLEVCACVEAFRMELDAVIGHVALSHNLMCLQTGNEHSHRIVLQTQT